MKRFLASICIVLGGLFIASNASAQTCEEIAETCGSYLTKDIQVMNDKDNKPFISDGQVYRAFLSEDQVAEFQTTLFGGNVYRIAASAGTDDKYIIFRVLDSENPGNVIFDSSEHGNAEYWNFHVPSTIDCVIEAQLDMEKDKLSGCAIMMIAFKQ
jgi:hypothetical protein